MVCLSIHDVTARSKVVCFLRIPKWVLMITWQEQWNENISGELIVITCDTSAYLIHRGDCTERRRPRITTHCNHLKNHHTAYYWHDSTIRTGVNSTGGGKCSPKLVTQVGIDVPVVYPLHEKRGSYDEFWCEQMLFNDRKFHSRSERLDGRFRCTRVSQ